MARSSFQNSSKDEVTESVIIPEDYSSESTGVIQCGIAVWKKDNEDKLLEDGVSSFLSLPTEQVQYLNMVAQGISSTVACRTLGIDRAMPLLWSESGDKGSLYNQCLKVLKRMEADDLEEIVWSEARRNPKSALLKMFALKARKDEYKDNAQPTFNMQTNIKVTVDGQVYDTNVNRQAIEIESLLIGEGENDGEAS